MLPARTCSLLLLIAGFAAWAPAPRAQAALAQDSVLAFDRVEPDAASGYVTRAVLRDGAGFLWASTQRGLDRYDGARITPYGEDAVGHQIVLALESDPARPGAFWAGTEGGGLVRHDPASDAFAPMGIGSGVSPTDTVAALLARPNGELWAAVGSRGVWNGRRVLPLPEGAGRPLALSETPGAVWVGTTDGLVALDASSGRPRPAPGLDALRGAAVTALASVQDTLWVGTRAGAVYAYAVPTGTLTASVGAGSSVSALEPSRARPGTVWVGTRSSGLLELVAGGRSVRSHRKRPRGLAHDDVLALEEDEQGLLWVGTVFGLHRADVRPPPFRPHPSAPGGLPLHVPATTVVAISEPPSDPGSLWLGQLRYGLLRYDRATGRTEPIAATGEGPGLVFSILEDAAGRLWAGAGDGALYAVDPGARTLQAVPIDSARSAHMLQVYEMPSRPGVLWLATRGLGLLAFDPATRRVVRHVDGIPPNVWRVHERPTQPGILWVGTQDDGLLRLDVRTGAVTTPSAAEECLPSGEVVSMASGRDGALWIGTVAAGVGRLDGDVCTWLGPDEGFPLRDAAGLLIDDAGRLWISGSDGLARYDPASGAFAAFDRRDGLGTDVFHFSSAYRSASGALFFGGATGVVGFDPSRLALPDRPPPVRISRLLVDGQPHPLSLRPDGTLGEIRLRPDQRDVAVSFAALDLRQPGANRYRAWMEGGESGWRSLGTQAETRYPLLPYGRYRLHVAGAGQSGLFAEAQTLPIYIQAPFWLRPWVWACSALLLLAAGYGVFRWRLAQILRVAQARQRIADDLHDDIGSRMSAVALRLDLVGRAPGVAEEQRQRLDELARTARGVVDELRDTVWMVDAGHDDLSALVARMEQFASDILRGRRYTFTRPDTLPDLSLTMDVRRHLYLLYKEALHNAVRHGDPEHVAVDVAFGSGLLTLTVADDGRGFDPGAVSPEGGRSGRGLRTLQTRADALGGTLTIDSQVGAGTTVRLRTRL